MTGNTTRRSVVVTVEDDAELWSMARDMVEACGPTAFAWSTGQAAHGHLATHADKVLGDPIDGIPLAFPTAERCPWIGICITSGGSAMRPEGLHRKVRFISKPWRAAEVLAILEGA